MESVIVSKDNTPLFVIHANTRDGVTSEALIKTVRCNYVELYGEQNVGEIELVDIGHNLTRIRAIINDRVDFLDWSFFKTIRLRK
ncbi:hypothetical protein AB832_07760 [Flavobacteriaceae bacterium (ex Bugula neritina AB1)]|nr:hypothetical protein AB832_07760 [Flavobacteriaceae bacterium (ex Bugula neritina AB1)]